MVKLEEVPDEDFTKEQTGPTDGEDDWDTDSDISEASDTSSVALEESVFDRVLALRDIIPPSTRRHIFSTASKTYSWASLSLLWGGKALWVVSTSTLLVGLPWALAYSEEQQMIEMEREMKMQQSASDLLASPGAPGQSQTSQPQAAL